MRTNYCYFRSFCKTLARSGYFLYESVADSVDYALFFKVFDLEDSFFSWFLITELHVWMLLVRAMAEGKEGRFLRNRIIEAMWEDVSTRAKKLDVHSLANFREQMNILSEQFQAAIIGYDEGLLSEDRELAGAIWRRFFRQECSDPEQIECLVKYVRKQVKKLDELPQEKVLLSPSITWIPLEPINNVGLR
ncbi:Protein of unknown function [Gryllus bimaculatus]|nr:Protein of unknown function [Gryllus bimaculatus]